MYKKIDKRIRHRGAKKFSRKFEDSKRGRDRRQNKSANFRDRPTLRKLAVCGDDFSREGQNRRFTERVLKITQTVTITVTTGQEVSYR